MAFRSWLLERVVRSTPDVVAVQRAFGVYPGLGGTIPFFNILFHVGAALGNEITFILFLPALFWEFDPAVARSIILLWCSSYYIIHVVKDKLQLPRPPAFKACDAHTKAIDEWKAKGGDLAAYKNSILPSIDTCKTGCIAGTCKLERLYEHEYGFPSSHTHNSLSMPLMLLFSAWGRYAEGQSKLMLAASMLLWVVLCPLSRLVLGVHSIPDVVGGAVHGLVMLGLHLRFGPYLDDLLMNSPTPAVVAVAVALLFVAIVAYPRPVKPAWVPTPGDTTIILAVTCGVSIACNVVRDAHKARMNDPITLPWNSTDGSQSSLGLNLLLMVRRLLFGFGVLFATRAVGKAICMAVLPAIVPTTYADADDSSVRDDDAHFKGASAAAASIKPSASGFGLDASSEDPKQSPTASTSSSSTLRQRKVDAVPESSRGSRSDPREVEPSPRNSDSHDAPPAASKAAEKNQASSAKNGKGLVPVPAKRNYYVELTTKAVVYTAIGWNAVYTVPWLFTRLGWK